MEGERESEHFRFDSVQLSVKVAFLFVRVSFQVLTLLSSFSSYSKFEGFRSYSYFTRLGLIPTSPVLGLISTSHILGNFPTCHISLGQIPTSNLGHFPTSQIYLGQIHTSQYLGQVLALFRSNSCVPYTGCNPKELLQEILQLGLSAMFPNAIIDYLFVLVYLHQ